MVTENKRDKIEKIIKQIKHPEIADTLFNLGMVENIDVQDNKVAFTLKIPMLNIPIKDYLINDINSAVKRENGNAKVEINIEEMDEKERAKFMKMAQEAWRG